MFEKLGATFNSKGNGLQERIDLAVMNEIEKNTELFNKALEIFKEP